jgi:hypothetical protein
VARLIAAACPKLEVEGIDLPPAMITRATSTAPGRAGEREEDVIEVGSDDPQVRHGYLRVIEAHKGVPDGVRVCAPSHAQAECIGVDSRGGDHACGASQRVRCGQFQLDVAAADVAFSSVGVPSAMMEPPSRTATREASWSASSRYWIPVLPESARCPT